MAAGAYFRARKGMRALASKSLRRSVGVVSVTEDGPRRPEDVTKMSSLYGERQVRKCGVESRC